MRGAVLLVLVCAVVAQLRVPRTQDGHHYGLYGSQVHLEIFVDLACDDCQAAWPHLRSLFDHYPTGDLEVTVHHLPLPFHRASFLAATTLECVAAEYPDQVWLAFDTLFANQARFSNAASSNLTEPELRGVLAGVVRQFGVSRDQFITCFGSSSDASHSARRGFKYALQRGALGGTPSFVINGVPLESPEAPKWTGVDWASYLDQFLGESTVPVPPSHATVESRSDSESLVQLDCQNNPDCMKAQVSERAVTEAITPIAAAAAPADVNGLAAPVAAKAEGGGGCDDEESEKPCPRVSHAKKAQQESLSAVDVMNS